ncbi:MAG TPA: response regulator, partial [Nitrospira sp.]|nr:response regulator [Nitrospira sp.]
MALWESKLMTLIACNERAVEKYRDHMATYPSGNQMDETFKRTLSAIQASIVSYQQTVLRTEGFADLATKVANQARKKALERLDALSMSVREPSHLLSEPISILLIDANHHARECYAQRLKASSSNYEIVQAATGRSGLDICARQSIDCVVLEIDLPDMSGFQVLEYLVWNASHPQMAVVVLTGLSNEHFLELALKNGAQAALQKRMPSVDRLGESILKGIAAVKQDRERHNLQM